MSAIGLAPGRFAELALNPHVATCQCPTWSKRALLVAGTFLCTLGVWGSPPGGESEDPGRVRTQHCAERFLCARHEAAQPSEGALHVALATLWSRAACRVALARGRVEQELQPVGVALLSFSLTAPCTVEPPLGWKHFCKE